MNILITGGAGYIGQALVKKVIEKGFTPIIIDTNETAEMMMLKEYPGGSIKVINSSIVDKSSLEKVFETYRPHSVIHAAAHKHISLVESNPSEAINNNIIGTLNIFSLCVKYKVVNCLYISTDKADEPKSVYGYTKKVGEELVYNYSELAKHTSFMGVRFCNVLGAPGTVIPIFEKQIQEGKPITITSKKMSRYFITLDKAVEFVCKVLFGIGKTGCIYMLDAGKEIRILDLAKDMIKKSGKNIKIIETGILPGERLSEPYSIGNHAHICDDIYLVNERRK